MRKDAALVRWKLFVVCLPEKCSKRTNTSRLCCLQTTTWMKMLARTLPIPASSTWPTNTSPFILTPAERCWRRLTTCSSSKPARKSAPRHLTPSPSTSIIFWPPTICTPKLSTLWQMLLSKHHGMSSMCMFALTQRAKAIPGLPSRRLTGLLTLRTSAPSATLANSLLTRVLVERGLQPAGYIIYFGLENVICYQFFGDPEWCSTLGQRTAGPGTLFGRHHLTFVHSPTLQTWPSLLGIHHACARG